MQDPLKELGAMIRLARQEQGLSVEALALDSRVSAKHIHNIENAIRSELPEDAYLIGFISKLLKTLKITNIQEIMDNFKKREGDYVLQSILNQSDSSPIFETQSSPQELLEKQPVRLSNFKVYHLYLILFVILLSMAWFVLNQSLTASKAFEEIQKHANLNNLKKRLKHNVNGDDLSEIKSVKINAGTGKQNLQINIKEPVWFQIIGIGQDLVLYEGDVDPLKGPNKFNFHDDIGFVLATGNAAGVEVKTENGSSLLGKHNEVIKRFYPESAKDIYKNIKEKKEAGSLETTETNSTQVSSNSPSSTPIVHNPEPAPVISSPAKPTTEETPAPKEKIFTPAPKPSIELSKKTESKKEESKKEESSKSNKKKKKEKKED